ncbi:glycosyltransferase family 8 protein [Enterococcus faecium]|nr:glycosyltransferase family 8 protein [Enterococcus faecium]
MTKVHIVYASDDRFCEILGVSLVSLYDNSKDLNEIAIYVLDSGISKENKDKLQSIASNYQREDIIFLPVKDITQILKMNVNTDRGSISQYARLFVSTLLPRDLDRVIYLDCDIIIKQSIKKLWTVDLEGKTIGALMDAFSRYYRMNIDLEPEDIMFNSGVMVIDLNRWKENNVEKQLLDFIAKKKGKIQQGDQGALNAILSKETYCLNPAFNSVTIFYDFSYEEMIQYRRPPKFYPKEIVENAVENPILIHFTTSFLSKRPWIVGCQHKYVEEWLKYKNMSPWNKNDLWVENKRPIVEMVCRFLPRKLVIALVSFLQVYGRPVKNRIFEMIKNNMR